MWVGSALYVVCDEDLALTKKYHRWMTENDGAKDMMEFKGSDQMGMFFKPQELCHHLFEIVRKYV